jgi:hypothetical protein
MSSMGIGLTTARKERWELLCAAQGLVAESFDRETGLNATALATQNAFYSLVPLRAGEVVTNIVVQMTANGATLTLTKVGLFKKDGTQLGVSADASASFTSGASKNVAVPLITPYIVPTDDAYYASILCVGTTPPTIARTSVVNAGQIIGSGVRRYALQASLSDMPSPAVFADAGLGYWFGIT